MFLVLTGGTSMIINYNENLTKRIGFIAVNYDGNYLKRFSARLFFAEHYAFYFRASMDPETKEEALQQLEWQLSPRCYQKVRNVTSLFCSTK